MPTFPPLTHVAFGCADLAELEKWARRLDDLGIDHGEIIKDTSYGSGLSFRDPDGIALEFFAAPARPRSGLQQLCQSLRLMLGPDAPGAAISSRSPQSGWLASLHSSASPRQEPLPSPV